MRYDYYEVAVPTDAFDNDHDRGQCAIDEARERARLYCIPATWTASKVSENCMDTIFKVVRKRN